MTLNLCNMYQISNVSGSIRLFHIIRIILETRGSHSLTRGIKMKQWTKAEKKKATKMYAAGKSYVDISNALKNKTYNQVRYFIIHLKSKDVLIKKLNDDWIEHKKWGALPIQQQPKVTPKKRISTQDKIIKTMDEIKDFLVQKNNQYGDSVFQPVRVFSKADKTEQIKVRIDDKLSRLKRGNDSIESDEDVVSDLIGYLVLLLISMRE